MIILAIFQGEYMDSQTLWERMNEAIDTIIRRDQSSETETADLLPPCVEASLNLGCVPLRASRSQCNSYSRSYLSPIIQEQEHESLTNLLKHPLEILHASTSKQLNPIQPNVFEDKPNGGFECDLTLRLGSSTTTTTFGIDLNSVIPKEEATVEWRKRKASVFTQEWHQRKKPGPF
ncbi:uncharacterized protein LOC124912589 [Impatiens glandulifera]|uniref:uncharacterized protein LOC124912589 n=1 Tax=Impatiens glandulifera TaxID=253017 RepID=UPI001FB0B4B6|nr:uncharacterized protein LOC124912589 [Impatiens glandulifera]